MAYQHEVEAHEKAVVELLLEKAPLTIENAWNLSARRVEMLRKMYGEAAVTNFFGIRLSWHNEKVKGTISWVNEQAGIRMRFKCCC